MAPPNITNERSKAIRYIELSLGGGMVDVELDSEHYEHAIDKALAVYRQRSSRAVEESFAILNLNVGQQQYRLPDETVDVRVIYRRSAGGVASSSSTQFDPFDAALINLYMINAVRGGMATYELYMGQRELIGRMFGAHITFTWNHVTKLIHLHRNIKSEEDVVLHVYNYKPDEVLMVDHQSGPWLRDYALAIAKMSLGQARSKFTQLAGPQGGVQLNGNDLIAQATAEMEGLEEDLKTYVDGGTPLGFIFG